MLLGLVLLFGYFNALRQTIGMVLVGFNEDENYACLEAPWVAVASHSPKHCYFPHFDPCIARHQTIEPWRPHKGRKRREGDKPLVRSPEPYGFRPLRCRLIRSTGKPFSFRAKGKATKARAVCDKL